MSILEILEAHLHVMGQRGTSVLCICGWHAVALGKRSEDLHRAHVAQVLEQREQERQDGPGHIDAGRLRRVLAEGQQLDPTTVRKLIDTVDSYQHTAFRESFNALLENPETSHDPLALADQKIQRVRELSQYLKKLAPGDRHYAELIDKALDGDGETR